MSLRTSTASGLVFLLVSSLTGCSSAQKQAETDALQTEVGQLRNQLSTLTSRLESMETRLTTMNDKIDSTRNSMDLLQSSQLNIKKPKTTGVEPHPSEGSGTPIAVEPAQTDPESGFVNDNAVQSFQQAKILFDAGKYPDAILAFTSFLQNYADHALAGAAQFYVGECYFQQREYKLATTEYKRVLTSYDRSHVVPQTLERLAEAADQLNLKEESARHRQLLAAMFPLSPANGGKKRVQPVGEVESIARETRAAPKLNTSSVTDPVPPSPAEPGMTHGLVDEPPPTAPMPQAQGSP